MKIASAQIEVTVGDINGNLQKHLEMITTAFENKVDLIVFPEMSLTGYCRKEGEKLAVNQSNPEIIQLKEKAQEYNLVIIVGAPIQMKDKLYIGSFILLANGDIEIYIKQFLHTGEDEMYSSSFDFDPQIKIKGETISLAICADIDKKEHPANAKKNNCSLYIPSIFFTKKGIDEGHDLLSKYAKKHQMSILMSNYSGFVWGLESGGKSGFWDSNGQLISHLGSDHEGLLIIEKKGGIWQ
jgi:predicted amidohydrolase